MKEYHNQNYYELLELSPGATQDEILKAYQRARNTYGSSNPALYSVFSKQEAQDLLKLIDEAYTVLSNQFKRKKYDEKYNFAPKSESSATPSTQPMANSSGLGVMPDLGSGESMEDLLNSLATSNVTPLPVKKGPPQTGPQTPPQGKPAPQPLRSQPPASMPVNRSTHTPKPKHEPTPMRQYSIDPKFEEEIQQLVEFDGPTLQKIRAYKNIPFDQVCDNIRIGRHYLTALEADDFVNLPAPVFVRGFVVQYARLLGLDSGKVATSYMKRLKSPSK